MSFLLAIISSFRDAEESRAGCGLSGEQRLGRIKEAAGREPALVAALSGALWAADSSKTAPERRHFLGGLGESPP